MLGTRSTCRHGKSSKDTSVVIFGYGREGIKGIFGDYCRETTSELVRPEVFDLFGGTELETNIFSVKSWPGGGVNDAKD